MSPVAPNTPEPLKKALEEMEATVQSTKRSMAFAAPELMDTLWGEMQMELANTFANLYRVMGGGDDVGSFGQG